MSLIQDDEQSSLAILGMVIHVVGNDEFEPQNYPVDEHQDFFLSRIRNVDCDPVFRFEEGSVTRRTLEARAVGTSSFDETGENLARAFSSYHVESSSEGAFFVFEIGCCDAAVRLYSLIKYDYSEALEQVDAGGELTLRRIVQAFVTDKRAIQKSALVRVEGGEAVSSVAATDRVRPGADIGDYFANFLGVAKERTDTDLTEAAKKTTTEALTRCKEILPPGGIPTACRVARQHLRGLANVDEDAIRAAVFAGGGAPSNEAQAQMLYRAANSRIRANKLSGVEFTPDRGELGRAPRRILKTREAVEIRYTDGSNSVVRTALDNGGERIVVTTSQVEEDRLL